MAMSKAERNAVRASHAAYCRTSCERQGRQDGEDYVGYCVNNPMGGFQPTDHATVAAEVRRLCSNRYGLTRDMTKAYEAGLEAGIESGLRQWMATT